MEWQLRKVLRRAALRWQIHQLLTDLARALAGVACLLTLAVCLQRLLALPLWYPMMPLISVALAGTATLIAWFWKRPGPMQVALRLDERLELRERFSTALALDNHPDPFARASVADANSVAENADLRKAIPLGPFRLWCYSATAWMCVAAAFWLLPSLDPLGLHEQARRQQQRQEQAGLAQQQIQQAARSILAAAQQVKDPALAAELAKLEQSAASMPAEDMKRQAIRKLGDLAQGMKMQDRSKEQLMHELNRMLAQLRNPAQAVSPELSRALAKGDFGKAADLARSLQNKLQSNDLSPDRKQALAQQLSDLGKQLQELAQRQDDLQRELEKAGLDKKLSQLSQEDLRKALEEKNLSPEQIEQLLQKASSCQGAAQQCQVLAKCLGACAGGDPAALDESLSELAEQLSEMEAMKLDAEARLAALREMERAKQCLGGNCASPGGQVPWQAGAAERPGSGSGGPGMGMGARESADSGQYDLNKVKAPTEQGKGPVVASWFLKGEQVKGEAQKQYQEVVQAARDNAAEAIKENEIPRKYEGAVKKYFGELDSGAAAPPANGPQEQGK